MVFSLSFMCWRVQILVLFLFFIILLMKNCSIIFVFCLSDTFFACLSHLWWLLSWWMRQFIFLPSNNLPRILSKNFIHGCRGIDLSRWRELIKEKGEVGDMHKFVNHVHGNHFIPNTALVDCTADSNVASHYHEWLRKGIHVITPNKKANSGPLDQVSSIWLWFALKNFVCSFHA